MNITKFLETYEDLWLDCISKADAYRVQHYDIGSNGINNDGMPHGTNISDRTALDAERLTEKLLPLKEAMKKRDKRKEEIDALLEMIGESKSTYVLRERYLCFRSLDEIARDRIIDRTYRQVKRFHDLGISQLEKVFNEAEYEI